MCHMFLRSPPITNHRARRHAFKLHFVGEGNSTTLDIVNSTFWYNCKSALPEGFGRHLNEVLKIGFRLSSTYPGLLDVWVNVVMQRFIIEVALVRMIFGGITGIYR